MTAQIVFLCLGNICRSPLAEALARQKFGHLGLAFSSVGLEADHGLPTSEFSIEFAAGKGASLDGHTPRSVDAEVLADATWLIAMTRSQGAIARSRFGDELHGHLGIIGAPGFDLQKHQHSPEVEDVDDPYGWPRDEYFVCGDQIDRLLDEWSATFMEIAESNETDSKRESLK